MTRNLSDKPHKTPHPDQPHAIGPARERNVAPSQPPAEAINPDELNHDSCLDDLNQLLTSSIEDPDPNLESSIETPGAVSASASPAGQRVATAGAKVGTPPRTSEIFKALNPVASEATPSAAGDSLELAPDSRPDSGALGTGDLMPEPFREAQPDGDRKAAAETPADDVRLPWTHLLLLSYSSALTLALIWMLWRGKAPEPDAAGDAVPAGADAAARPSEPRAPVYLPPLPRENLAELGQSIRLGDLEATPVSVSLEPLTLVRSIDPDSERKPDGLCLVLRLRFKNHSRDNAFTPLERALLRDSSSAVDRSYIESASGARISLYPLAIDSEWSIRGQEFSTLEPGQGAESIIASEPIAPQDLPAEMTWRVRVRVGPYRTDVLGARFRKDQVTRSDGQ